MSQLINTLSVRDAFKVGGYQFPSTTGSDNQIFVMNSSNSQLEWKDNHLAWSYVDYHTGTSSIAVPTGTEYFLTVAPIDCVITSIDMMLIASVTGVIRMGIFRGDDTSATLVAQGALVNPAVGRMTFSMTEESGQTRKFSSGERLILGISASVSGFNVIGNAGYASDEVAWTNGTGSSGGFPSTPAAKSGALGHRIGAIVIS